MININLPLLVSTDDYHEFNFILDILRSASGYHKIYYKEYDLEREDFIMNPHISSSYESYFAVFYSTKKSLKEFEKLWIKKTKS